MQMKGGVMGHHKAITSVIQADNRQPQTADVINVKTFQMNMLLVSTLIWRC